MFEAIICPKFPMDRKACVFACWVEDSQGHFCRIQGSRARYEDHLQIDQIDPKASLAILTRILCDSL